MISVTNIISTCVGIKYSLNTLLHSNIFLPPNKNWPDLFNTRMMELMEQDWEHFLDNYVENEENDDAQADEQVDDKEE